MIDGRERILAVYEAFGRGDLPAVLDAVADQVDWGVERDNPVVAAVPFLGNVQTRDEVASKYFAGLARTVEFTKFQPLVVAVDGNDVVAVIAEGFTNSNTGKAVETTAVHHFTLDDNGNIVRYRPFVDTHAFIESTKP
jgi:uncharacterized protein